MKKCISKEKIIEVVIMVRSWWRKNLNQNQKGNVTVTFLASMVIFLFLFVFILNLSKVWYSHSQSQAAADGASLAASVKANEIVSKEITADVGVLEVSINIKAVARAVADTIDYTTARRLVIDESTLRDDIKDRVNDKQYNEIELVYLLQAVYLENGFTPVYLTKEMLGYKLQGILSGNEIEIATYVRDYVTKNGSIIRKDAWRGQINFNHEDGRAHVIPGTELKPVELSNMQFPQFAPVEGDGAGPDLGYLHWMNDDLSFDFGS